MKYVEEFRDSSLARAIVSKIDKISTKRYNIMEVCGGQTHSIMKHGIDQILAKYVDLIHGPGCPVCVTPVEMINRAIEISLMPNVIFTSFGDMLRVPGSTESLLSAKSRGADIRMVYSPLESLKIATDNPDKEIVFFGVGFETTAPANAMTILQAYNKRIENFSAITSHVLVPPAIEAIMSSPGNRVQGFLAAGHVCTVMGFSEEYIPLSEKYKIPIVVTGFEPLDVLEGVYLLIKQFEEKRATVENQYHRVVKPEGNAEAKRIINDVFEIKDRAWRGIGVIPKSGFTVRDKYKDFDALRKFVIDKDIETSESKECISGLILQGIKKPHECDAFGKTCTPIKPLGATMVSAEGACSAYYQYQRVSI